MENIKIAIIDSGIDAKNEYLMKYVKGGKSFILNDSLNEIIEGDNIQDNHGHGTECAYTILRENKNVEIFPIKVLDKSGKTNSQCLLRALEFLIETEVKLINISLSTINFEYEEQFKRVCDELISRKKIIVSSMDNSYRHSLPSALNSVVGVRGKNFSFPHDFWYNKENSIQCICDNEPILLPGLKEKEFKFFGHNSKSAALMTSKISKLINTDISLDFYEIDELLHKNANRNNWSKYELDDKKTRDFKIKHVELDTKSKLKADIICKLIMDTYNSDIEDINFMYNYSLLNNKTKMNKQNCYQILYKIEEEFNIKIDYGNVSLKTFNSIYELLKLV